MHRKESLTEADLIKTEKIILKLYITGASPNSLRAVENIKQICDDYASYDYDLEIIDIYQRAECAEQEQLTALPVLIKKLPLPKRKITGDLSDKNKVLKAMGIMQHG
jgi:circadian clock protein KaiB